MSEPKLLTQRPSVTFDEKGLHVLIQDVVVDLGLKLPELENWAWDESRRDDYEKEIHEDWLIRPTTEYTTCIRVETGFTYDGASLPTLEVVRWIAGPKERYELAGLLHDKLYRVQAPKTEADYVFWLIAKSGYQKVGRVRAWLTWAVLRLFGGPAYLKNGRRLHDGV